MEVIIRINCCIFIIHKTIDNALHLSLSTYAQELQHIVIEAMKKIMNDTSMSSVCNKTDSDRVDCELSNYNPCRADEGRRSRMLNDEYSYNSNTSKWLVAR